MTRAGWMKWLLVLLVLAALGVAGWYGLGLLRGSGDDDVFASGNGRIEATEVNVATKLGGRLQSVEVEEGDFVTQGQVLARMDARTLEASLRQAQAEVVRMRHKVTSAQETVTSEQGAVAAARALVAQRVSEERLATKEAHRSKELHERGAVSDETLDIDQTTKQANIAQTRAAQAQLNAAQAGLKAARAGVLEAQAAVASAEASAEALTSDLEDTVLRAPVKGRVLYRLAEPGEVLAVGGNVLTLLDISNVYMTFFLPTDFAGRVAMDAEARIVLDAVPNYSVPARVTFVSPQAQFTPKSVETKTEREKLMFRIKARISQELLDAYARQVKTGLPGVVWVRLDAEADWPASLPPLVPMRSAQP